MTRKVDHEAKDFNTAAAIDGIADVKSIAHQADSKTVSEVKDSALTIKEFNRDYPCIFTTLDDLLTIINEILEAEIIKNRLEIKIETPFYRQANDPAQCFNYPWKQYLWYVIKKLYSENILCNKSDISEHAAVQHYLICMMNYLCLYFNTEKDCLHEDNIHLLIISSLTMVLHKHGVKKNAYELADIFLYNLSDPNALYSVRDKEWLLKSNEEILEYAQSKKVLEIRDESETFFGLPKRMVLFAKFFLEILGEKRLGEALDSSMYRSCYHQLHTRHLDKSISHALVARMDRSNGDGKQPDDNNLNQWELAVDNYIYRTRASLYVDAFTNDAEITNIYIAMQFRLRCMNAYLNIYLNQTKVVLNADNIFSLIAASFLLVDRIHVDKNVEDEKFVKFFDLEEIKNQDSVKNIREQFLNFFTHPAPRGIIDQKDIQHEQLEPVQCEFTPLLIYLLILKNSGDLQARIKQDEKQSVVPAVKFECQKYSIYDYLWRLVKKIYFTGIDSKDIPQMWTIALHGLVKAIKFLQLYLANGKEHLHPGNVHLLIATSFLIVQKVDDFDDDEGYSNRNFLLISKLLIPQRDGDYKEDRINLDRINSLKLLSAMERKFLIVIYSMSNSYDNYECSEALFATQASSSKSLMPPAPPPSPEGKVSTISASSNLANAVSLFQIKLGGNAAVGSIGDSKQYPANSSPSSLQISAVVEADKIEDTDTDFTQSPLAGGRASFQVSKHEGADDLVGDASKDSADDSPGCCSGCVTM